MEDSYQVVTHGLRDGVTADVAGPQLAALFKCTREQIEPVLASPGCVVKKGLSMALALRYQQALEQCGMHVVIEPYADNEAIPVSPASPIPLRPSAEAPAPAWPEAAGASVTTPADPIDTATMVGTVIITVVSFVLAMVAFRLIATMERGLMFWLACVAAVVFAVLTTSGALTILRWLQRRKHPSR